VTTYRLFPSTSGPATAISYGGSFLAGVAVTVTTGGAWFSGYWWWVASNAPTTGVKFALWSLTSSSGGSVVSGSTVTAGTLTASAWNFVPLATPLLLAPGFDPVTSTNGSVYVAAAGFTGNFSDTNSMYNSGDTYAAGITNGPLVAYSGKTGTLPAPYSLGQGLFSTAGADPSVNMPNQTDSGGDGGSNFWIDVSISDTAPAGYSGSYRLWPNKADANPTIAGDSAVDYTVGTEVHLSQPCTLNKVWYYSQSGAANLATRASVWSASSGLEVAVIASPSWSGAAGSGWISASFAGGTTLPAGSYIVSVYNSNGTVGSWAPKDATTNYWGQGGSGGVGANGITQGPLYAPPQPSATSGWTYNASAPGATPPYSSGVAINAQPPFGQLPGGGVDFPQLYAAVGAGTNQSQNYWVDLEVTPLPTVAPPALPAPGPPGRQSPMAFQFCAPQVPALAPPPVTVPGAAALTGSGTLGAAGYKVVPGSVTLTGSGTLGATEAGTYYGTAGLSGTGTLAAAPAVTYAGAAGLSGTGSLTAAGQKAVPGAAALSGSGALAAAGQKTAPGAGGLSGSGTLTAQAQKTVPGAAGLSGSGSLTATESGTYAGAAGMSGTGTLSSAVVVTYAGTAALSGTGSLAAAAQKTAPGAAGISGTGSLAAAGFKTVPGAAPLAGSGTLTASGTVSGQFSSSAGLSGSGTLVAPASGVYAGAAGLNGTGLLAAAAVKAVPGAAGLAGLGALAVSPGVTVPGAAQLSGSGLLGATGTDTVYPGLGVTGLGTLGASVASGFTGTTSMSGSGTLSAVSAGLVVDEALLGGSIMLAFPLYGGSAAASGIYGGSIQ
jgi:hypothetical protein